MQSEHRTASTDAKCTTPSGREHTTQERELSTLGR
jgi:hypothetical protein